MPSFLSSKRKEKNYRKKGPICSYLYAQISNFVFIGPISAMPTTVEEHPGQINEPTTTSTTINSLEGAEFPELLKQYYGRLFPYKKYFRWLSYGLCE